MFRITRCKLKIVISILKQRFIKYLKNSDQLQRCLILLNRNNLIFFMFIRFPAILLVKTMDSYLHEFCARGILHSDFQ